MASQTKLPLNNQGKANKSMVLLQIMQEEQDAGRELDIDRIVERAQERISSLATPEQLPATNVNRSDYRQVLPRLSPSTNGRKPSEQGPVSPTPETSRRIPKTHILAQIIREEQEAGRTLDRKKILLIAQKRVEQLPEGQQPEYPVRGGDYDKALRTVRGLPSSGKGKSREKPTPPPQQPPVGASKSIDLSDLMAAKLFVSKYCDGDITRAEAIFSALNTLMKEWSK